MRPAGLAAERGGELRVAGVEVGHALAAVAILAADCMAQISFRNRTPTPAPCHSGRITRRHAIMAAPISKRGDTATWATGSPPDHAEIVCRGDHMREF